MDAETIKMLCSPYTRESLRYKSVQDPGGKTTAFLEGVETGERFPIVEGIPILYDIERLDGFNLHYQGFYRKVARYYDPAMKIAAVLSGRSESGFRQQYLRLLELRKDCKVLEVSVGTGANLALLPPTSKYYGLDLSWNMLSQCRKVAARSDKYIELFLGNAECLPFHDAMFDVVLHVGGINAFNDRAGAIREMIRVAKSGTKIVIVDETAKTLQAFKWVPSVRKMIAEWGDRFEPPVQMVPAEMKEIQTDLIVKGNFYILSFRVP